MAAPAQDPNDELLPGPASAWWLSLRFRWLVAAPLLAFVIVSIIREPLDEIGSRLQATWQLDQTLRALRDEEPDAALEKINSAIESWPMSVQLYMIRAETHRQLGNLRGCLADYDIAVHLAPSYAEAYMHRAAARRLLGYGDDALEDVDTVIALQPRDDLEPLNLRAYYRALEGAELHAALDDIQRAISSVKLPPANWLDTRACVYLGLGKLDVALDDANEAIRLTEKTRQQTIEREEFQSAEEKQQRLWKRTINEPLAVMYHHRSQIHAALGKTELARRDAQQAAALGFRPEIE